MKLEAAQRILSWVPNDMAKTGGEAAMFDTVEKKDTKPVFNYRGYDICHDLLDNHIYAFKGEEWVGAIDIQKVNGLLVTMSSGVRPEYVGQGIGLAMYEAALKVHGILHSSADLSKGSSHTWKKLCQKHHGVLMVPVNGKDQVVNIIGWREYQGYAYPLVLGDNGKAVPLAKLLSHGSADSIDAAESSFYRIRR